MKMGVDTELESLVPLRTDSSYQEVSEYAAKILAPFFKKKVNPGAAERDENQVVVPRKIFEHAARLGILNYLIPREVGGGGGSRRIFGMILEEIGYYTDEASFATMLAMYADVPNVIYRTGKTSLIEHFVKPMARGEILGTFAYTDYGDAFDFKARCTRKNELFILNGTKCLQTGGAIADVFVVYVEDEDRRMKIFLIERNQPGVSLIPITTLGLRSAGLTQLHLKDVEVHEERLLNASDGLGDAQVFLNSRRLFVVCPMVGGMRRILEECTRHLGTIVREGQALTRAQTVQARLGLMSAQAMTSQAILHTALDHIESSRVNEVFDPFVSAAKLMITEAGIALSERAIRLTGWQGYSNILPYERHFRAFMSALTGQTAQDVLEIQLGVLAVAKAEITQI